MINQLFDDPLNPLSQGLSRIWSDLSKAATRPRHPLRWPGLASIGLDGSPKLRTVVLRAVMVEQGVLICHTDVRSEKVAELTRDPRVAWLFQSGAWQIRAEGQAETVRQGDVVDQAWAATPEHARRSYRLPEPPGTPIHAPELAAPTAGEVASGRDAFCLLRCRVDRLDHLHLGRELHRRARYRRGDDDVWQGEWVMP